MQIESPCYDKVAKKDCPRRREGCAVSCPDWAKYCEQRDKMYKENEIGWNADIAMFDNRRRQFDKRQRKNIADRKNKTSRM